MENGEAEKHDSRMWYHRSLATTGAAAQKWDKGNAGQLKQRFCTDSACFRTSRTDRPTDRPTDGWTNIATLYDFKAVSF